MIEKILIEDTLIQNLPSIEKDSFGQLRFFLEGNNNFLNCSSVRKWYEILKERCSFETSCMIASPPSFDLSTIDYLSSPRTTPFETTSRNLSSSISSEESGQISTSQTKSEEEELTSAIESNQTVVPPLINSSSVAPTAPNHLSPAVAKGFFISGICLITVSVLILLCNVIVKGCMSKRIRNRSFYPSIYVNPLYDGDRSHLSEDIRLERI